MEALRKGQIVFSKLHGLIGHMRYYGFSLNCMLGYLKSLCLQRQNPNVETAFSGAPFFQAIMASWPPQERRGITADLSQDEKK